MIVLDEQLGWPDVQRDIAAWYQGSVLFVTNLQPGAVIKDDAIPRLLRRQNQPTFVTINERHFWRRVELDRHFGIVCFAWPDFRVGEVPERLRSLLRHPDLRAKAQRMGKVIRVTDDGVSYYSVDDRQVRSTTW